MWGRTQFRAPTSKMVQIKTTLSDRRDSRLEMIESDDDEKLTVKDIFEVGTESYRITRIEDSTSRPNAED